MSKRLYRISGRGLITEKVFARNNIEAIVSVGLEDSQNLTVEVIDGRDGDYRCIGLRKIFNSGNSQDTRVLNALFKTDIRTVYGLLETIERSEGNLGWIRKLGKKGVDYLLRRLKDRGYTPKTEL